MQMQNYIVPEQDVFITAKDLANWLRISESKVSRMVKNDELPHHHIGKSLRFCISDIRDYLKKHRNRK